jgi:predicted SnoaL-like aldol condensation-catalyzing enzyme
MIKMDAQLGKNKYLVCRYYEINMQGSLGIEEVVTDDFVDHHFPPTLPPGPEGVKQFFNNVLGAVFSDMRIVHDEILAEGDKVVTKFALHARHTDEFAGIPAKDNQVVCPAFSMFRIENGKLAEAWEIADLMGLFEQMKA